MFTEITFTRKNLFCISNIVVARFDHEPRLDSPEHVLAALTSAVTRWIKETTEGQEAIEESAWDLNIGDLLNADTSSLPPFLVAEGISSWSVVYEDNEPNDVAYDRLLYREQD